MRLRTVIFPVAGLGTRLLPASKVVAKELLPIIDRPLIQWATDEAIAAGATRLVFVINRNKHQIADHYDCAFELEHKLERAGKTALLKLSRSVLPAGVEVLCVTQAQALGLGHAVLCAASVVDDPYFGVILPDDFIYRPDGPGALAQMAAAQSAVAGGSLVAVEPVPADQTDRYGIVRLAAGSDPQLARIEAMVEKPKPAEAPSNLAVVGRYLLSRRIFELLSTTTPGAGGEIQLTDAIAALLAEEPVRAWRFEGTRYDCGNKLGLVQATIRLGLDDPEIGAAVQAFVRGSVR